jgi:phage terminase large subunit-like protein
LSSSREIELYATQYDFVTAKDRFTAFIAGIGSGKTFGGAVKGTSLAKHGTLGLVVSPTYPMLRDATLRAYGEILGDAMTLHKGEMLGRLVNGAEILFRSADQPDRLRGPNIHWAHLDEGALCPRGTWEIIIGRLRADGGAGPCFVTSTPKGRNWLYERTADMRIFRAHTRDNPYISREFVDSLERSYTGKFAEQELAGEFVGFEGLVYEEFSRDFHVSEGGGQWKRVIIGADEGYTNPAVLLVIGEDNDGRAHVIEEFYQRRVLQGDVVQACRKLWSDYRAETVQVDPSAAGLIAEMRAAGIPATPANNTVRDGIQAVKSRLARAGDGRPRLTFAPACANTIAEFESYAWRETGGAMRDEPEKINDHAMDALRYGVMYLDKPRRYFG